MEYRESLKAVREMLERAGSARAVGAAELRARRVDVLTLVMRQRALMDGRNSFAAVAARLSDDMETLLNRLDGGLVAEVLSEPTAVIETADRIVAA